MIRDTIQGLCALHTALARMDGHQIDKPAARYSAMADYVDHVLACGHRQWNCIHDLIWEAVATGLKGHDMNIPGQPFDRSAYRWMEAT